MRRLGERGAVTAEFAVALPAVLVVLVLGAGVLASFATTVRVQQLTTEAARLLGRGDDAALQRLAEVGATASVDRGGGVVCVRASARVPMGLPLPPVSARACALDGGR
ncbi:hypothetical protein ASE56_15040 [Microbacterium sp. Leaf203]|jgi:hypothetical protein|nr:hypothetical protein ASE56_15040 [Microbacterium sp. Leaf203]